MIDFSEWLNSHFLFLYRIKTSNNGDTNAALREVQNTFLKSDMKEVINIHSIYYSRAVAYTFPISDY